MRHRDSQHRAPTDGRAVFITTTTYRRCPYFTNPILAELFVLDLHFARKLKEMELYGYAVLPDHVRILFRPCEEVTYSEVMRSLKTNFARDANDILLDRIDHKQKLPVGDVAPRRLRAYEEHMQAILPRLRHRLVGTSGKLHDIPRFRWQKSFRDRIIRSEEDFHKHLNYIYGNAVKHQLVNEPEDWKWMWVMGMPGPIL